MNRRRILFPIVAACLVASVHSGCRKASGETEAFGILFEGFRLVRVDTLDPKANIDALDPMALHDTQAAGGGFEPGRVYVLKKDRSWSNPLLAVQIFPQRLRNVGAKVLRAPASPGDLMCHFVGPMRYRIEFEYRGRRGYLLNGVEHDKQRDALEEVVLFLVR